jgi:hypothetical protein
MVQTQRPSAEAALRGEISTLPGELLSRLRSHGFDVERIVRLAAPLAARAGTGAADVASVDRNRVRGVVEPPRPEDVPDAPAPGTP